VKGVPVTRTLGVSLLTFLVVLAVSVETVSIWFVVTEPGTLLLLGAGLITAGVWSRRLFFSHKP